MQKKLMKFSEDEDGSSLWQVACECAEPHHNALLYFEPIDEDYEEVSMYLTMDAGFYSRYGWWETLKRRAHAAFTILFVGRYEMTGEVMLKRDGLVALKTAIDQGIAHADKCRAAWEAKKAAREAKKTKKT